ncbi:autophagy protein 13 [Microbotryomycetes sp. JL221]|nr:autophagy protein 13 [Microbotryomycetes sp. JL221]
MQPPQPTPRRQTSSSPATGQRVGEESNDATTGSRLRRDVSGSSSVTSGGKVDQIVQHFFAKTCAIVSQSRMSPVPDSFEAEAPLQLGATALPSRRPSETGSSSAAGPPTLRRTSTQGEKSRQRTNKWFNIELPETDHFRAELKTWRNVSALLAAPPSPSASSVQGSTTSGPAPQDAVPAMVLDVILDAHDIATNQVLVLSDQRGKRIRVDPALAALPPSGAHQRNSSGSPRREPSTGIRSPNSGRTPLAQAPSTVVLERWTVRLLPPPTHSPSSSGGGNSMQRASSNPSAAAAANAATELPAVYKHAIIQFRSLYTLVRLLPAWNLHRRLTRRRATGMSGAAALKIGCRMSSVQFDEEVSELVEGEIDVGTRVDSGEEQDSTTETINLPSVQTPVGNLSIQCTYRRNTDFSVEEIEALLSSKFIDEDFFKPTLAQFQQQTTAFASMRATRMTRAPAPSYGSLSSRHPSSASARGGFDGGDSSRLAAAPDPAGIPLPETIPQPINPIHDGGTGTAITGAGGPSSVSSSGRFSAQGSSAGATRDVEPAFISLSRARGASYSGLSGAQPIQRAVPAASSSAGSTSSAQFHARRASITVGSASSSHGSPIFRASSYLSSPPPQQTALSSSPSANYYFGSTSSGPTSNINRTNPNPSSNLSFGFSRQAAATTGGESRPSLLSAGARASAPGTLSSSPASPGGLTAQASSPPPTLTPGAASPSVGGSSSPRPIPLPGATATTTTGTTTSTSYGSAPRTYSYGSYSRSYGRPSSGPTSGGIAATGSSGGSISGGETSSPAGGAWPWSQYHQPGSFRSRTSFGGGSGTSLQQMYEEEDEKDLKQFAENRVDDSSDINDFLNLIDESRTLFKSRTLAAPGERGTASVSATGASSSASATSPPKGKTRATLPVLSKMQLDEQLKMLRGSVLGSLSTVPVVQGDSSTIGPPSSVSSLSLASQAGASPSGLGISGRPTTTRLPSSRLSVGVGVSDGGETPPSSAANSSPASTTPAQVTSGISRLALAAGSPHSNDTAITSPTAATGRAGTGGASAHPATFYIPSTTTSSLSSSPATPAPAFAAYTSRRTPLSSTIAAAAVGNVTTGFSVQAQHPGRSSSPARAPLAGLPLRNEPSSSERDSLRSFDANSGAASAEMSSAGDSGVGARAGQGLASGSGSVAGSGRVGISIGSGTGARAESSNNDSSLINDASSSLHQATSDSVSEVEAVGALELGSADADAMDDQGTQRRSQELTTSQDRGRAAARIGDATTLDQGAFVTGGIAARSRDRTPSAAAAFAGFSGGTRPLSSGPSRLQDRGGSSETPSTTRSRSWSRPQ